MKMTAANKVIIHPLAWEFISAYAREFKVEVYGWLVGYNSLDATNVLCAYDCQEFKQQTLISAVPVEREFWDLTHQLPPGISVVGMYHSHPKGSEIFHSHIDDDTVSDYLNLNKQFVSIVTNGSDTECFTLEDEKTGALKRQTPKLVPPTPPAHTRFRFIVDFYVPFKGGSPTPQEITSKIASILYERWGERKYFVGGAELDGQAKVGKYDGIAVEFEPLYGAGTGQGEDSNNAVRVNGNIEVSVYHLRKNRLSELDKRVRDGLLNQLNQRVMNGRSSQDGRSWELAPVHSLEYLKVPFQTYFPNWGDKSEAARFFDKTAIRAKYLLKIPGECRDNFREDLNKLLWELTKFASDFDLRDKKAVLDDLRTRV
ncbi:MAG: Mov34/MPN/PAD-1 family protein [Promethearchaeota archaeon]